MLGVFITVPVDFMATLTGYTSDIFNDFKPFFLLLGGLFLGVWIVQKILEVVLHREISSPEEEEEEL
jgi:hypothetical protein